MQWQGNNRRRLAALLFRPGFRPTMETLEALGQGPFSVAAAGGTVELLCDGLAFRLSGISPAPAAPTPPCLYRYGLPEDLDFAGLEAVSFGPGLHLQGAEHLPPVLGVAAEVLLALMKLPGLVAVSWIPAANLVPADMFADTIAHWLNGGPVPAFALVSLVRQQKGGVASFGLAFLTGCEFRLEQAGEGNPTPLRDLAIGLVDWLARHHQQSLPNTLFLPGAGQVTLAQAPDGKTIFARPTMAATDLAERAGAL